MESILGKLIAALLGALLTWGIARYYNRPRLYCALSRLYEYSSLADGSNTVQLVIANRGRKTEESVEVQLSTDYQYHLLATTQNGIDIPKDKIIRLPALLPKSELSIILVAEGKPRFSIESIKSIRSKSAKGIIGSSLTEADSAAAAPAAIILLLLVALMGYGFGKTFGEEIWWWGQKKITPVRVEKFTEGCLSGYSNAKAKTKTRTNKELSSESLKAFSKAAIKVKQVSTQGDLLKVDVEIENLVEGPIEYSLSLLSHASDSTIDWKLRGSSQVYNIVILNRGEKRTYSLSEYFPAERKPKKFWLEARVELFDYWVSTKRTFFFGEDTSLSCSTTDAN